MKDKIMNLAKIFSYNGETNTNIRTLTIDTKTYFVAKDIAETLGYVKTADAVRKHCVDVVELSAFVESFKVSKTETLKEVLNLGNAWKQTSMIQQNDILRLIIKSKLPTARRFESWVFNEVLPSILNTGQYGNEKLLEQIDQLKNQLTNQVMHGFDRQLITDKKLDEMSSRQILFGYRRSTLPKILTVAQARYNIIAPREDALKKMRVDFERKISSEHAQATTHIKSYKRAKIYEEQNIRRAIEALRVVAPSQAIDASIYELEQRLISIMEDIKREVESVVKFYESKKVIILDEQKRAEERITKDYEREVELETLALEKKLDQQQERVQAFRDGKIAIEDIGNFSLELESPQEDINF